MDLASFMVPRRHGGDDGTEIVVSFGAPLCSAPLGGGSGGATRRNSDVLDVVFFRAVDRHYDECGGRLDNGPQYGCHHVASVRPGLPGGWRATRRDVMVGLCSNASRREGGFDSGE